MNLTAYSWLTINQALLDPCSLFPPNFPGCLISSDDHHLPVFLGFSTRYPPMVAKLGCQCNKPKKRKPQLKTCPH